MQKKELDYLNILKALNELPFNVGKKLLVDFLRGDKSNSSITRNSLDKKPSFGCMAYEQDELMHLVDNLLMNGLIRFISVPYNKYLKVLQLTNKGIKEISNPQHYKKKLAFSCKEIKTEITEKDRELFKALDHFLGKYNDEQKKAIISCNDKVLCIAGAGSGKTTVLTKRIQFLSKYRSVDSNKILAITFTRKARSEMLKRISEMNGMEKVRVETFNSFCEKLLRKHNDLLYDRTMKVINYRDKIIMTKKALNSINLDMGRAINIYFTYAQRKSKTQDQLANIFMNDCFFIRDYLKFKHKPVSRESFIVQDSKHAGAVNLVYGVCNFIEDYMKEKGLRDFADQLIDVLRLFETHPETIPQFEHILVDEYQDVNSTQIKLLDTLNSKNLFCVGDPRQSIYGWRGSDIGYIMNFEDKYPDCEIVTLTKNYRSNKHIVNLINKSISSLGLNDLESIRDGEKDTHLLKFNSENEEFEFIVGKILSTNIPRSEIFVLARTNKQLNELSVYLKAHNIKHIVRSDETRRSVMASKDDVTLATVHAIKGLEAKVVFVIGASAMNFPCKASEHPVVDLIKVDEYDKEEEEKRLFYVAMSRAKDNLYITYSTKSPTYFITDEMQNILKKKKQKIKAPEIKLRKNKALNRSTNITMLDVMQRLKDWRRDLSQQMNTPAYIIFNDKTILDIAQKMPSSKDELKEIHGLGPTKIMKYGDDILGLLGV